MHVRVKFVEAFKDGTIFPRSFAAGEVVVMTEQELARVRNSGGTVEVVENVIPNPLKAEKEEAHRNEVVNDPNNPHNSINNLEEHVPGLEDEVEEVKERESARKEPKKKK